MRLIDADELMEHVGRDRLDSRELIMDMIENAPTVEPASCMETDAIPISWLKLYTKLKCTGLWSNMAYEIINAWETYVASTKEQTDENNKLLYHIQRLENELAKERAYNHSLVMMLKDVYPAWPKKKGR